MVLKIIFGFLIGLAAFYILEDAFRVPLNDTFKAYRGLDKQLKDDSTMVNDSLSEIAKSLAKWIRMDEYKRAVMAADLRTAHMTITPERFVADCIVKAFVIGIFAIPAAAIWPILGLLILMIAVVYYYNTVRSLGAKIKRQRQLIDFELSQFVFTIEKTLRHSRDVLLMIEAYTELAGPELKEELQITSADMRSGNYETAITRLETRVGSTMMSDVCRGLLSIMRGDDTASYWQSLEMKFEDYRRETLKAEALKVPRKVSRLSMVLLITFTLTWFIVIGMEVIKSLEVLFN